MGACQNFITPAHTKISIIYFWIKILWKVIFCCFCNHFKLSGEGKKAQFWRLNWLSELQPVVWGEFPSYFGSCYKEVDKTSGVLSSSGSHFLLLNALILHLNAAVDGLLRRLLTPRDISGFLVLSLMASAGNHEVSCSKSFVSLCGTVARTHTNNTYL